MRPIPKTDETKATWLHQFEHIRVFENQSFELACKFYVISNMFFDAINSEPFHCQPNPDRSKFAAKCKCPVTKIHLVDVLIVDFIFMAA